MIRQITNTCITPAIVAIFPLFFALATACTSDSTDGSASVAGAGNGGGGDGNNMTSTAGSGGGITMGGGGSNGGAGSASTLATAGGASTSTNPMGLGPAPVALGATTELSTAGGYVLLAKTAITNVTGSSISGGHVGLSPAAASFISGFALVADPSNEFSTSTMVVAPGKLYASDYAAPTPTNLTTAVLDMEADYLDAASRTTPDFLNLGSGSIGGLTLAPGLYTWGSGVTIANDVTIAGGANDVWIFQIANDLDVSSAKNVLMSGGASAKNVFWAVAGQVTIHANAHFEGTILCKTAITFQTAASMHGRALAQSLIALDNNAITAP
jgi:hypothetical protein